MIEFRHVSKDFHGKVVLSDISMEIPTGELTVLIGPSGCGKMERTLKRWTKCSCAGESVTSSNRAAYSPT